MKDFQSFFFHNLIFKTIKYIFVTLFSVEGKLCDQLAPLLSTYKEILKKNMLLKIQFTTLSSYLHLLHEVTHALQPLGENAILYLAAAVSDFYIPHDEMVKIIFFFILYIFKKN